MTSQTTGRRTRRTHSRLGVVPEFEGLVMPRYLVHSEDGQETRVRDAVLWDTAEGAFAYFNHWSLAEKQERLKETLRYTRESRRDTNAISLPTMERWEAQNSDMSLDQLTENVWDRLVVGVKRRHEGMDSFLTKRAIEDASYEPHLTRGGIWHAIAVRRGDEEKYPAGEIILMNAEIKNGRANIAGFQFDDPTPLSRKSTGRERRHGVNLEVLHTATYPPQSLLLHIHELDSIRKSSMGLPPDYDVIMPFNFDGQEYLVVEAVGKRYLPIQSRLNRERNIFAVSNFLNDHPEIYSGLMKERIQKGSVSVGVGKLWFADSPHRGVLDAIDDFFVTEQKYEYSGFAVDFREYGENYQTVSVVYRKPDLSRSVHVIYDEKFGVPPLFLFKIKRGEWGVEQLERGETWKQISTPETNPFESVGQWYTAFDRHSQQWLVNRITRPDQFILAQFPGLVSEYNSFEQLNR